MAPPWRVNPVSERLTDDEAADVIRMLNDEALILAAERDRLRDAITAHHDQKADDRCIEDDDRLYAAAGLGPCDRRVGDKEAMLANCRRFIERRCEGGGWPSYAELEAERDALRKACEAAARDGQHTDDCGWWDRRHRRGLVQRAGRPRPGQNRNVVRRAGTPGGWTGATPESQGDRDDERTQLATRPLLRDGRAARQLGFGLLVRPLRHGPARLLV
jgi:hypothetical protein